MTSVNRALAFSLFERYGIIAFGLASYVLIARVLTPEEIGIYSVTAALVGVAQMLRDFGIGNYLIQTKELDQRRLDTAMSLALGAGILMFLIFLAGAPLAASFYRSDQVSSILLIVSINFLALPFCSIGQALLRRELRFQALMHTNLLAAAVGFFITILLAFKSFGPASLALGIVATNITTALGTWLLIWKAKRPRGLALEYWRDIFRFGRHSTVAGMTTSAASDINDLGVGRILGFAPVAILSRAMGPMYLMQRDLVGAARNVALPFFAKIHREKGEVEVEAAFLKSTAVITVVSWPYYGFLALFPLESLRLLAGPQWDSATPLVMVFAAAGALVSISTFAPTLLTAVGRVDLASHADMLISIIRAVLVLGAAIAFRDLMMVAIALLISFAFHPILFFLFKNRFMPMHWSSLFRLSTRSAIVTIITLIVPAASSLATGLGRTEPISSPWFAAICAATIPIWFLALRWCGHSLANDLIYIRLRERLGLR